MKDNLNIEELFAEKLSHHESPVRADLWQGIQTQLAAQGVAGSSAVAAKGISLAAKWIIGVASSVFLTSAVVLISNAEDQKPVEKELTANVEETVSGNTPEKEKDSKSIERSEFTQSNASQKEGKNASQEFQMENLMHPVPEPLIVKEREHNPDKGIHTRIDPVFEKGVQPKDNETTALFNPAEETQKEVVGKISKLPNVISPNDDQINDYLALKCENLKEFSITIMNQRNEVIFTSNDIHFKWYGDKDGVKLPVGTYYYFVTAIDEHNHKINKYNTLDIRY